MIEPSVAPGFRSENGWVIRVTFPMRRVTAMVSPTARPRARVAAARMPELAPGTTTLRITCQGVAPNAKAASRSRFPTPASAVRERATMVGRIMIDSTKPARKRLGPSATPLKSSFTTGIFCMNGSTSRRNTGCRTKRPQSPTTMLGTAAMRSMPTPSGVAMRRGHISVRNEAVASPTGTAMSMAMAVITTVPRMNGPAPYWLVTVLNAVDHRKPIPKWPKALVDWLTMPSMMAARMTTKNVAAATGATA
jgi:hypothetical protein